MPHVDLADDSFIAAPRRQVASRLRDATLWARCWPGLHLTPYHERGADGVRWYVEGRLVGTAEVWLEPYGGGTLVHVYLRADRSAARRARRGLARTYQTALKRELFALKDALEARSEG